MTESEAIEVLKDFNKQVSSKADGTYQRTIGEKVCEVAIKALEEVQQYRALGTPDDLKTMKENGAFTGGELAQIAVSQMLLRKYTVIGTPEECQEAIRFKEYFDELYGQGLEIANWHQNGDLEPFDNFYDSAID